MQADAPESTKDLSVNTPSTGHEGSTETLIAAAAAEHDETIGAEHSESGEGDARPKSADSAASEPSADGAEPSPPQNDKLKWYAVNTYSGQETRARLGLIDRIERSDICGSFGEVLVPTETVIEMVKGQRRKMTKKFYPGYMFVQMELNELTYHLVRNTPKITGFLGGMKPQPVHDSEIQGINQQITEASQKPEPMLTFDDGESVRVIAGPFSNFDGIVQDVRPDKRKLRVLVSIFGRATPVELDFNQVEKS